MSQTRKQLSILSPLMRKTKGWSTEAARQWMRSTFGRSVATASGGPRSRLLLVSQIPSEPASQAVTSRPGQLELSCSPARQRIQHVKVVITQTPYSGNPGQ